MKTITLPMPTLGEIFKEQVHEDVQRCREIVISIADDLKNSFMKTYSPSCMPFN